MSKCDQRLPECKRGQPCGYESFRICGKEKEWDAFFNVDNLDICECYYVLWIDIMGIKKTMVHSFKRSAIFIGKLHSVVLDATASIKETVKVCPVMDGVYIAVKSRGGMLSLINAIFSKLAQMFILTSEIENCFIVRGGLAFGPIVFGDKITSDVSRCLAEQEQYKNMLLFGLPLVQANEGEGKAPPFGIHIDNSARAFSQGNDKPYALSGIWLKWCDCARLRTALKKKLDEYFAWARNKTMELEYNEDRLAEHEKACCQFWH